VETNGIYEMVRNYIKNVDNCRIPAEAPLDERGLRSARKVQLSHAAPLGPLRGRAMSRVVPAPGRLWREIRPPSASIRSFSPARPDP
jgi:hypothetical protein